MAVELYRVSKENPECQNFSRDGVITDIIPFCTDRGHWGTKTFKKQIFLKKGHRKDALGFENHACSVPSAGFAPVVQEQGR